MLRASRVLGRTIELFEGDREAAKQWLTRPQRALGGATAAVFDGETARRFGGRWNSVGTRVIYAAESRSLAALGDAWVARGSSAVLAVPSAIIAEERNYLLNPQHRDVARATMCAAEPFLYDERLIAPIKKR